ncbi:MAG: hypothetical protein Q8Q78_08670 [Hydrogenophaga sp.]|nr:hypothetical protein [Hydrogenophaga sp.]
MTFSSIKGMGDTLTSMHPLFNSVSESLQSPVGLVTLLLVFVWLLVNKDVSHLFNLFERKERRRFELLEQYLSKPEIADKETRIAVSELRDAHYFKAATGIYAEKTFRHALLRMHAQTSFTVNWMQIRRARPHIELSTSGDAIIKPFLPFEIFGYWYNTITVYTSLLGAAITAAALMFSNHRNLPTLVGGFLLILIAVAFAIFVARQNWPYKAALHIQKELSKVHSIEIAAETPQRKTSMAPLVTSEKILPTTK